MKTTAGVAFAATPENPFLKSKAVESSFAKPVWLTDMKRVTAKIETIFFDIVIKKSPIERHSLLIVPVSIR
jgi:hypothetical protein